MFDRGIIMKIFFVLVFFISLNFSAFSHSQLTEILPEDNVTYNKAPPQIKMKFMSKVKLVKIELLEINKKEKIDLDFTSTMNRAQDHVIPMPILVSGIYRFQWRALSPDGHIIKGKSDFEVK